MWVQSTFNRLDRQRSQAPLGLPRYTIQAAVKTRLADRPLPKKVTCELNKGSEQFTRLACGYDAFVAQGQHKECENKMHGSGGLALGKYFDGAGRNQDPRWQLGVEW